jgi:alkylation response protein AidB-like acyl-CoA dehydrogenase
MLPQPTRLTQELRSLPAADIPGIWPQDHWDLLMQAGAARWNIPENCGGENQSPRQLLNAYRDIARGSLVAAFLLTQRNAACQRIDSSANAAARTHFLPPLARGEFFATVGISHLTTSRQHLAAPAVAATALSRGRYSLSGCIPWASGVSQAQLLVTGGTCSDGRQILAALDPRMPGVRIEPAVALLGLSASCTSAVQLDNVIIEPISLLHGPVDRVMAVSGGGAGSLSTTAVALGAALGTLDQFSAETRHNPELTPYLQPFLDEAEEIDQLLDQAINASAPLSLTSDQLRHRANSLAMRSAHAWLAATKGAGFTCGHPAERAVRESLFFLVWSCPQPVLNSHLSEMCRTS